MVGFHLEKLNNLEFLDFTEPSTEQGVRDLMAADGPGGTYQLLERSYGIEVPESTCEVSAVDIEQIRATLPPARTYGPTTSTEALDTVAAGGTDPTQTVPGPSAPGSAGALALRPVVERLADIDFLALGLRLEGDDAAPFVDDRPAQTDRDEGPGHGDAFEVDTCDG